MNLLDCLILIVVVFSIISGYQGGIIRTALSVVALTIGVAFSGSNYQRFAVELAPMVHSLEIAEAIWFVMLILVAIVASAMLGHQIQAAVNWHGHGLMDHLGGATIGVLRGIMTGVVCVMIAAAFFPKSDTLLNSRLTKYFFASATLVSSLTTEELKQRVFDGLQALPTAAAGTDESQ
jgi:uncharacterized membrane protein required for colicin V production